MRLIDELRAPGARLKKPEFVPQWREAQWTAHAEWLWSLLREEIPVLLIDNVAHFYYTTSDQENWSLDKDFPNLAPSWPVYWAEYKLPKLIHSKQAGDMDVGALCPDGLAGMLVISCDAASVKGEGLPPEMKWLMVVELFIDYGRSGAVDGPHGTITMAIDAEGRVIEVPWIQSWTDPGELADLMKSLMSWIHPLLLAISFLHCKNVRVVDNQVDRKLAKRTRERHGIAPTPYKTLVIEPLKQILRTEGRSGEVGLAKAMHICRGHFRDYREGRGLFGKYHQLVWTPSVVRGTKGSKPGPREVEVRV